MKLGAPYILHMLCILCTLCILYLVATSSTFADEEVYAKVKSLVNDAHECSFDDVQFIDTYNEKLYWIWTNNLFRYLRVKLYLYESDAIYKNVKRKNGNALGDPGAEVLRDDFFTYKEREEFIRIARNILSNEKSLAGMIHVYTPKKEIKFFQEFSENQLIDLLIKERKNLINAFKKFKLFQDFRDVSNSKYYYQRRFSQRDAEHKVHDNARITPNEEIMHGQNKNPQIKHERTKNVITFNIEEIPRMMEIPFDFYDRNKWNKYSHSMNDEEKHERV
ncbi:conserved Plasmodium protein, unknown function [Plasmodium knowlesi strain H]|uniref:Uncharacterized protein n=3 Tax=Plasmodium knowlesi TaxID=5850 RepID=A0A5K1UQS9_PLAKH|nr:conserved Plasmodium protein, unknown function [Plasmodium knowlesi strain H]OTN64626.1 Uncharacterized protein PKNOH_S130196600 [Plasmodium knowlesi]CAA9989126.1 conserved Plasmodium protein, unknown function [Plasmodium knowlesi strain H]SBO27343.1 conserved Plasmodium protein, unknown function [Plasmodium knowlesi strain H]SBO27542.1 conserved Plasmodium protein, unknown function [Plasmodium knowlesi strain H]VVS78600.1 conserved Plasmodium protein, unknown function [Plasmodium knowlesi |eukprot:XP_002261473.1 hypothetical protein, conserved in Plasmodium species [Plasmodium knowlesi strain H]